MLIYISYLFVLFYYIFDVGFLIILSRYIVDADQNIVLIQPQRVKMKLRPGSSQHLQFRVGQSRQYPLDLYFLLDLSWSMNKTRNTVATKGSLYIK